MMVGFIDTPSTQVIWDGGGDGKHWDDMDNWDRNTVPNVADYAEIDSNIVVLVRNAGEKVAAVILGSNATLEIVSGDLTIENTTGMVGASFADGIEVLDKANIIVHANAALNILNIPNRIFQGDGIYIRSVGDLIINNAGDLNIQNVEGSGDAIYSRGDRLEIINSGTMTFGPNLEDDAIYIDEGIFILNNFALGIIQSNGSMDETFMEIRSVAIASINNYGLIQYSDTGEKGMELGGQTSLHNYGAGRIISSNTMEEALELDGITINDGIISIIGGEEEGIDMDNPNARFVNNGSIAIKDLTMDEGIDVGGYFENNGTITITQGAVGTCCPALYADEGQIINNLCGIINITSQSQIEVDIPLSRLDNHGIISTVYTGNNINDGVFNNSGTIASAGGVFTIGPNALSGSGKITSGPIPAKQSPHCPSVPTMSQWGIICLALLLVTFGFTAVRSNAKIFA